MNVIVDPNEDIGRVGFSGLLAEVDRSEPLAAESPQTWAPVARSAGPVIPANRDALERFHRWLEDRRQPLAS